MGARPWMLVVWPAFLVAAVLEMIVFAMVDPGDLQWLGGTPLPWSRQAVYTVAFFVFWIMAMFSSALTLLLSRSSADLNR